MTELVRQDPYLSASLDEKRRYIEAIAQAGDLLPKALMERPTPNPAGGMFPPRAEVGKVLLLAETGAALGIHPMAALQSIHIIDGKPSLSANLLAALVRRNGHKLRVRTEGDGKTLAATAELIRSDDPDYTFSVTWSHSDAERAGLLGKDNWKKYERAMLKARAITEVIREGAPDVTLFAAYSPEELGAQVDESGEMILEEVREAAPARPPRQQAPIVDPPTSEPAAKPDEPMIDWGAEVANLSSSQGARDLYGKARNLGLLDMEIKQGRKKVGLGQLITDAGMAFVEAEKNAQGQAEVEGSDEPVDAEIIDDGSPMALGGE